MDRIEEKMNPVPSQSCSSMAACYAPSLRALGAPALTLVMALSSRLRNSQSLSLSGSLKQPRRAQPGTLPSAITMVPRASRKARSATGRSRLGDTHTFLDVNESR
jgi:hypothetical protein